jgi:hypothetical protein
MCDTVEDITEHKDVLWLQIITQHETFYIASVYSNPKNMANHDSILKTLKTNLTELSNLGTPIIMGDLNCSWAKDYCQYSNKLKKFTEITGLTSIGRDKDTSETWSFKGPMGQSHPSHILTSNSYATRINGYKIHEDISLNSYHRLISCHLTAPTTRTDDAWGRPPRQVTHWSPDNCEKYRISLHSSLEELQKKWDDAPPETYKTRDNARNMAKAIQKAILAATTDITKPSKDKTPHTSSPNKDKCKLMQEMITRRNRLILRTRRNKEDWHQIHALQRNIGAISRSLITDIDKVWWEKLAKVDPNNGAKEFWKLASNLKAKEMGIFPTFMRDADNNIVQGKENVLNHIRDYYQQISENKDKEATDFKAKGIPGRLEDSRIIDKHNSQSGKSQLGEGISNRMITLEEVEHAIAKQKNHKAPGHDGIQAECLKQGLKPLAEALHRLFNLLFELGFTPESWQLANTILIHKKGPTSKIENYRPITLLCTIFKVWERVLEVRLRMKLEVMGKLSPLQMGSRKNLDTLQALLTSQILMKEKRCGKIYMAHIDLSKAYNRIVRSILWKDLAEAGIKGCIWNSIISTYASHKEQISIGDSRSRDPYSLPNGLRQGSVLSPLLFILYINKLIITLSKSNTGILAGDMDQKIPCLMFVDDLQILASSIPELERQISIVNSFAITKGCVLNSLKTHLVSNDRTNNLKQWCSSNNLTDEPSRASKYLGTKINPKSVTGADHVTARIQNAHAMLHVMKKKGLHSGCIKPAAALHILRTSVFPSLMYGMETMTISKYELSRLDYFMANCISGILYGTKPIGPAPWVLWEGGCLPAEQSINEATIRLYRRVSLGQSITRELLLHCPNNFLTKKVHDINSSLNLFKLPGLLHMPKDKVNTILRAASIKQHYDILPRPDPLCPYDIRSSKPEFPVETSTLALHHSNRAALLLSRASAAFIDTLDLPSLPCNLCDQNCRPSTSHRALHCTFPPLKLLRSQLEDAFHLLPGPLFLHWTEADDPTKLSVILGGHWSGDPALHICILTPASTLLNLVSSLETP